MTGTGNGWRTLLALLLSTTLLGFSADAANAAGKRKTKRDTAPRVQLEMPKGPLTIVVSLDRQRLFLYGNGKLFAESPISSGTPGHPTPTGVFSIIQKNRFHRSNLYADAPMPYMQRITWSGVAMHTGALPGYPASHGCIRLPDAFAQKLWRYTRLGARVIVQRDAPEPYEFSHPRLFNPKPVETVKLLDAPTPALTRAEVQTAEIVDANKASDAPNSAAGTEPAKTEDNSAPAAAESKPTAAKIDIVQPAEAAKPIETAKPVEAAKSEVVKSEPAKSDDPARAGTKTEDKPIRQVIKAEPPRPSAPVSVFVSRKAGKLYVRRGFEPLFETNVTIRDADKPMGTHVFTAMELRDGNAMRWNAVSMHSETQRRAEPAPVRKNKRGQAAEIVKLPEPNPVPSANEALDRIDIPQETVERIAAMLVPGSSLMISDNKLSDETGRGTDFIISTRAAR
jgi:hypothetical protein